MMEEKKGMQKPDLEGGESKAPAAEKPKAAEPKKSIIVPPSYEAASSPHQHSGDSIAAIMWWVFTALVPAALVGVYYFGWPAVKVLAGATLGAMAVEAAWQAMIKQEVTVSDGSAAVTGLLLGMNLPPASPLWMVLVGSFIAIFVGKQVFGGLGYNPFNPALVARVFLLISFPVQMTTWSKPSPFFTVDWSNFSFTFPSFDAATGASPLGVVKMELMTKGTATAAESLDVFDAFLGNIPGSAGEVSGLALLLGVIILLYKRIITWHIPVSFVATVMAIAALCHSVNADKYPGPAFQLVTGGLLLGAFFMATDYVTSPVSPKGMLIFGSGCGFLTIAIRYWGGYPEGVSFAILLMNMMVPLIDTYTQTRVFGEVKSRG